MYPLQFSKYIHMHDSTLPLQELRKTVPVSQSADTCQEQPYQVHMTSVGLAKSQATLAVDILNITFEVEGKVPI